VNIEKAKEVADAIRQQSPEQAAKIDALIAEAGNDSNASLPIRANIKMRLEKFHGDKVDGAVPFEVIESEENLI
jgi:hypothetical protein